MESGCMMKEMRQPSPTEIVTFYHNGKQVVMTQDDVAFEMFAYLHPHEAYSAYPLRFWKFFHKTNPTITRKKMKEILKRTDGEK